MTKLFIFMFSFLGLTVAQTLDTLNCFIGDFNGDGFDDIFQQIIYENEELRFVSINTADIFYSSNDTFLNTSLPENFNISSNQVNTYIGDFNGDGLDDFLSQDGAKATYIFYSTGNSFSKVLLSDTYDLQGDDTNLYVGDFNGDGRHDILRQKSNLWDSESNPYDPASVLLATPWNGNFKPVKLPELLSLGGSINLYIGDFNGDGNDDIIRQEKGELDHDELKTASLLLSTGLGTFNAIVLPEDYKLAGDFTNFYIGDFNGDGYDDILRQEKGWWTDDLIETVCLLLANGYGGWNKIVLPEELELSGDYTNLYIGDFNGDGKDDILVQENGTRPLKDVITATLLLSLGDNGDFVQVFLPEDLHIVDNLEKIYVGDFNGDGKDDFIQYINKNNPQVFYSHGLEGFIRGIN